MQSYTNKPVHPLLTGVPAYIFPSVFTRGFAILIDLLGLSILIIAVASLFPQSITDFLMGVFSNNLLGFYFFLVFRAMTLHTFGTTPGLSLFGLQVVSSIDLGRPTFKSLLLRTPFQLTMILVFTLWFFKHRMTAYDMICNVAYIPSYLPGLSRTLSPQSK